MKYFPVTILDNFYENPDFVRDYALSLEYFKSKTGNFPGERSKHISIINKNLFRLFCNKLFSIFFDPDIDKLSWNVDTNFQKISSFSNNKNDIKNSGWIHQDDEYLIGGLVYLNPNPNPNWGTSIYSLNNGMELDCEYKNKLLHLSDQDFDEYEYTLEKTNHNNKFTETIRIENLYNRLILYDAKLFHGVPNYYSENGEPRLTQVFFVKSLVTSSSYPLIRSRMCNI